MPAEEVRQAQSTVALERRELASAEAHLAGRLEDLKLYEEKIDAARERVRRAQERVAAAEHYFAQVREAQAIESREAAAGAALR